MKFDIDIVYTWCSDADAVWRNKKNAAAKACGLADDFAGNADCRFADNDDLKYSLRSLELYVPWVRKVFLVIDDDITPPAWIKKDHPKLRIVRLGEIMLDPKMPCFCSDSIEHRLAFIPDLAEHYLYSNDDCLFGRRLAPSFFFGRGGCPVFRFGKLRRGYNEQPSIYLKNLDRAERLVADRYPLMSRQLDEALRRYPHHCIDAYVKQDVLRTYETFRTDIEPQFAYPFRREENVQRLIYALDALARGHGRFRLARFRLNDRPWYKRLLRPGYADSLQFYGESWRSAADMLRRFRPGVFCFNDTETQQEADRVWLRRQYETLFPRASSFEREAVG